MNYELAKRLKETGFPQEESEMYWYKNGRYINHKDGEAAEPDCANPTLEELIEECGESLKQLNNHMDSKWGKKRWTAKSRELDRSTKPRHKDFDGETPTEAVANLWLALRGK